MGVWSSGDIALTEQQMTGSDALRRRARGATSASTVSGHWMQLEAPEEVNALLLDFLTE